MREIYSQCTKFARVIKVSQVLVSHFLVAAEIFGNTQVIISAHMNVLLKLSKLNNDNEAKLISFYNAVEGNI